MRTTTARIYDIFFIYIPGKLYSIYIYYIYIYFFFRLSRFTFQLDPFRAAVPFWAQTARNLKGLSPERSCGSRRVNSYLVRAGGFTLSDLLPKSWSQMFCLHFYRAYIRFRVPTARRFSSNAADSLTTLALSADQFSCMKKSPRICTHSVRIEPTKLILLILRGTLVNRTYGIHQNLYI